MNVGATPQLHNVVPVRNSHGFRLKRPLDALVAGMCLVAFFPLLIVLAIAVKLHSPGPIIYRQVRVGKDGKPFAFLKFRSMRHNADPAIHREHVAKLIMNPGLSPARGKTLKLERDPRITGLGCIMRKTSLDELPQLINVVRGEMSLVGPRPPLPYELELYQEWHKRRLAVLPGITGLWQVKGRNRVSFDEMVLMDLYYIDNPSLWRDLKILALTPIAVLFGKGAG